MDHQRERSSRELDPIPLEPDAKPSQPVSPARSATPGVPASGSSAARATSAKPRPCPKCGYDLRGTAALRCPECNADVSAPALRQHGFTKAIEAQHRRDQYWKPLAMVAIGLAGVIAVLMFDGRAGVVPWYLASLGVSVPLGLAAYWLLCMMWIGFDEPFHVTALKLAAIFSVVDMTHEAVELTGIPYLPWVVSTAAYIGLLIKMLDLETTEAVAVAVLTNFLRTLAALAVIAWLSG